MIESTLETREISRANWF